MGFYDRDYYRQPARRESFGRVPIMSVTMWLIVINVAMFLLEMVSMRAGAVYRVHTPIGFLIMSPLEYWCHFSAFTVIVQHQIWRFITFQFLHAGIAHIAFNMFALYMFGPMLESYLGRRRFLAFYLICGAAGGASYILLWQLKLLVTSPYVPLVGASAGIFGVLIAAAFVAPNATIMLLFPPIPMQLRTFAWVLIAIAVFSVFTAGHNAGGEAAHLGGAAMGAALMSNPRVLNIFDPATWRR
jgi:membrane associated rhomboid family serine protease